MNSQPMMELLFTIEAMGEIEGLSSHDIFSEFQDMHCYGGGNESYIEISDEWIPDNLYDLILQEGEHDKYELAELSDEELLSLVNPSTNYDKVRYRLFEMMVKGDLPKEFIVHLWW